MKVVTMHVKPRSNKDEVEQVSETEFIVRVKAEPTKGIANKNALKLLAHHLDIPFSRVMLTKGEKFQIKTVLIMDE